MPYRTLEEPRRGQTGAKSIRQTLSHGRGVRPWGKKGFADTRGAETDEWPAGVEFGWPLGLSKGGGLLPRISLSAEQRRTISKEQFPFEHGQKIAIKQAKAHERHHRAAPDMNERSIWRHAEAAGRTSLPPRQTSRAGACALLGPPTPAPTHTRQSASGTNDNTNGRWGP